MKVDEESCGRAESQDDDEDEIRGSSLCISHLQIVNRRGMCRHRSGHQWLEELDLILRTAALQSQSASPS